MTWSSCSRWRSARFASCTSFWLIGGGSSAGAEPTTWGRPAAGAVSSSGTTTMPLPWGACASAASRSFSALVCSWSAARCVCIRCRSARRRAMRSAYVSSAGGSSLACFCAISVRKEPEVVGGLSPPEAVPAAGAAAAPVVGGLSPPAAVCAGAGPACGARGL